MSLTEVSEPPDQGYGVTQPSPASLTLQSSEDLKKTPLLSLSEYVFGTYHAPGMVVGAGDEAVNNTGPFFCLMELTLQWGNLGNK